MNLRRPIADSAAFGALTLAAMVLHVTPAAAQGRAGEISQICGECKVEKFATCGDFLEGAAFDPQGAMWMVSLESSEILKVTPDGQCTAAGRTHGKPNGARFHTDGRLLITDRQLGVLAYDTAANRLTTVRKYYGRENLRGVNDLAVDKQGGVYFTEPYGSNALRATGRVFYMAPDHKKELVIIADNLAFPNGVVLSPNEKRLYIGDYATNRIIAVPLDGPGVVSIYGIPYVFAQLTGGTGPDGMTVDANGNLYAAHYRAGEVVVIDRNGWSYGAIRLPEGAGAQATNVALHGGYLYITESGKNDVWRVKTNIPELKRPQ